MTEETSAQDEEYYQEIERITQLFNAQDYMGALDLCVDVVGRRLNLVDGPEIVRQGPRHQGLETGMGLHGQGELGEVKPLI